MLYLGMNQVLITVGAFIINILLVGIIIR